MFCVPWKLKSACYAVFDVTGEKPLYFLQKHLTGRSKVSIGEISPHWIFHRDVLNRHGAKKLVEFGAGKSLAQNIYLAAHGFDQVVVDINAMLDLGLVNTAIEQLAKLGVATSGPVASREELNAAYRIDYRAPLDVRALAGTGERFDANISTTTLEHIPRDDIASIWHSMRRILKSGGIVSAVVDYSDHYAHTDPSITPLNYLQFSARQWRHYNHRSHYQNRLRHQHHVALLREAGFEILEETAHNRIDPGALRLDAGALTGADTDLCTVGFIVAKAP